MCGCFYGECECDTPEDVLDDRHLFENGGDFVEGVDFEIGPIKEEEEYTDTTSKEE